MKLYCNIYLLAGKKGQNNCAISSCEIPIPLSITSIFSIPCSFLYILLWACYLYIYIYIYIPQIFLFHI